MDPTENADSGTSLWNGVHQGVKPFGISKNPKTHCLPADKNQANRVISGEQPDPRFPGGDPPSGPMPS